MKINCYDSTGAELKNLTQWEQNRILKISGLKCDGSVTCHMFNNPDGMALVVPARYEGDQVITQVPNIFLQEASPIVIGVCEEAEGDQAEERMLCSFSIPVMHFAKPFDYHFVEDLDYRNWVEISNEVKETLELFKQDEEKLQGVIANGEGVYERLVDLETSLNTKLENGDFDGFSPTASVAKSGDVTTITVTDKDGTTTAEVKDYTHSEEFSNLAAGVKADAEEVKRITESMVKDLTNYYQKSETYSQEEINQLVSAIPKFALEVVDVLPKENISETTIYLLTDGKEGNLYTEYIYVNEKWEILGSQQIDLSGYYPSTKVDELLAGKQPIGDYALKSDIKPSAQADWSVNDELDPAFVKNRIGGYDVIEKDYLINKTDAVFNFSEPDKYVLYFPDKEVYNKLQEGQFVVIDWGDKTCQSVVKRLNNSTLFIGDGSLFNQPHLQSTEPFCFNINKNQVLISTKETGNKRTVKARRSVPRTIDKKYIPTDSLIIDTFYTQWNAEIWKQIQDAWDENKKIFINLATSGLPRYALVLSASFVYNPYIIIYNEGYNALLRIAPSLSDSNVGVDIKQYDVLMKGTSTTSNNDYYYLEHKAMVIGSNNTNEIGAFAFAQGENVISSGDYSHAEGNGSKAEGNSSHAEGFGNAIGDYSHAEGLGTAIGDYSHAEGDNTEANGDYSHAEGSYTIANGKGSHAQGRHNIPDTDDGTETGIPLEKYAHIVGNGDYNGGNPIPSNAHTLDWQGNGWYQGDVLCGGENMDDPNAISLKKVAEQAGTQADWNISDPSNSGFIKNRPFFKEFKETEIFPETTMDITAEGGLIDCKHIPSGGEEITVGFDGEPYSITLNDFQGVQLIGGNLSIAGMGVDTGEPFLLTFIPDQSIWMMFANVVGNHVVKIVANVLTLKQIEKEFIPNMTVIIEKDVSEWTDEEWAEYVDLFKKGERLLYVRAGVSTILGLSIDKEACFANVNKISFYERGKALTFIAHDIAQFDALTNSGADYIFLKSPDGKKHVVEVNNEGQLIVKQV